MSRQGKPVSKVRIPAYGLHKASGQARVVIEGRTLYLGKHGSPESHEHYARVIAKLASLPRPATTPAGIPPAVGAPSPLRLRVFDDFGRESTVNEILVHYLHWADGHYRWDGERTKEYKSITQTLGLLRGLFGTTVAAEFGPRSLQLIQQAMIEKGWCRKTINSRVGRIRRIFKWAVREELVPPSVFHGLATVGGLQYRRTAAPESAGTQPIPLAAIEAVLPFVSPPVAAMIQVQYLAAMRPAEVTIMRPCDLDKSDPELWIYRPSAYKTAWLERPREVFLGPQCRDLLEPYLARGEQEFLFSPIEAEAWRNQQRAEQRDPDRKSPVYPCELRQRVKRKRAAAERSSKRAKRNHYDVDSYRRAVAYGIKQAKAKGIVLEEWSPQQLRHTMGTKIRKEFNLEAAQVSLGHSSCDVTQVYAQRNRDLGIKVAKQLG